MGYEFLKEITPIGSSTDEKSVLDEKMIYEIEIKYGNAKDGTQDYLIFHYLCVGINTVTGDGVYRPQFSHRCIIKDAMRNLVFRGSLRK